MLFDKNGNLIPQKIKYKVEHEEETEEVIENYIRNDCNFKIKYDNKGEYKFKEKE